LPPATFDATVEPAAGATRVIVTARSILRDLTLQPDRLDPAAEIDEAGVKLLPGESVTFTVTGTRNLDPAALTTRPVLRRVNDIV
jgi:beta-mannosidase